MSYFFFQKAENNRLKKVSHNLVSPDEISTNFKIVWSWAISVCYSWYFIPANLQYVEQFVQFLIISFGN